MKKLALTLGFASALLLTASSYSSAEQGGLVGLGQDIIAIPNVIVTELGLAVCQQRLTQTPQEHAHARVFIEGPRQAWATCGQRRDR
jgi:hypothetical protein